MKTDSVERTLRRAVLLPVAVAAMAGIISLGIIQSLLSETELLRHGEEVMSTAEQIRQMAVDMETGIRGYLLTGDRRFLEPRDRASRGLTALLAQLKRLVADNPEQMRQADVIEKDIAEWQRYSGEAMATPPNRDEIAGKVLMDRVREDVHRFLETERSLSIRRSRRVHDATIVAIVLTFGMAIAIGALLVFFIRRELFQVRTEYERALATAEEAAHAKDRLLATVSHELRTPLTAILGWSALMRKADFDKTLEPMALASIDQSARLQARLVEDLIDVSRMAAGKLRIEVADIDVRNALEAAVETMQPAADAKRVALKLSMDDAPMRIAGDAARLQQVFWNLISNAVRFTPAEGTIDVSAHCDGDVAVVRVADTGIGIEREFLSRIFERFAQVHASARSSAGLGLGLDIARQLVELHGGTITASSEGAGRGSVFVVRLPRRA